MRVTYTLSNLTHEFYEGGNGIEGLFSMTDAEKFAKLNKLRHDLSANIKQKVGTGQFRDAVELNSIIKSPAARYAFKLEPRRGYKLATFDIQA